MNEDKATRYQRYRRRADLLATLAAGALLAVLVASGASFQLRELAGILGAALPVIEGDAATVLVLAAVLLAFLQCVELPFAYYQGFLLEHRYGLSRQSPSHWIRDQARAAVLGLLFGVAAISLVYAAMRWSPAWWWALSAAALSVLLLAVTQVAPVLLLPLFYRISPLDRPALAARLLALAERAGTPIVGVFEWQVSGHTRKANAALAGMGRTRRILLSDTLLADYSDDEIEVVLAHELAHHVHHDLWRSVALHGAMLTSGLLAIHLVLTVLVEPLGLRDVADPAGQPLLLLLGAAWTLLWLPLSNAVSRAHERRADRFALETTRNVPAFVSAMRRLSQQNLAEADPSPLVTWLFHSHPPTRARVQAARAWAAGNVRGG